LGRLDGKVILVTGAGDGMAREVCLRFGAEGAKVVGCDINAETAEQTLETVRASGAEMESLYPLDLRIEEEAHRFAEFAAEAYGGVDVLYNNAMSMRIGTIEELSLDDWNYTMANTLTIQFLVTKHVIPHLRARGGGSIIFVGSISGLTSAGYSGNLGFLFPYACAKGGVLRMTTVLANDLADDNIRVNALSPGNIATDQAIAFYGQPGEELRRVAEGGKLLKRLGEPDDVAKAAVFLASDDAAWITGDNLLVDGGFVASGGFGRARQQDRDALRPVVTEYSADDDQWSTSGEKRSR
jgi:meso-butanediol dehydrogenase/(S,S)-butanediol dehydrogenase/diacetyl reductase